MFIFLWNKTLKNLSALNIGRACAKSQDGAGCSNWTSDQWLWRQMSYYILVSVDLKQVENMYDDFVKVMPR